MLRKNDYDVLHPQNYYPYQNRPNFPKHSYIPDLKSELSLTYLADCYAILYTKSRVASVIYLLQLVYGLRFIDVKNIKNEDITSFGLINVTGSKKSNQRVIYFPDLLPYVSTALADKKRSIIRMSYRQYYSIIRRAGVIRKLGDNRKNYTVTHLMRKFAFEQLRQAFDMPMNVLRTFSGHKSQAGLNYYIGKKSLQAHLQAPSITHNTKES